ncbi:MAG: dipeptide epimerase [Bacteroidota bacterium]
MIIKEVKSWMADLELTRPYAIANKTVTDVRNAFVEVTLANGIKGIGAANPSERVVGESVEQAYARLSDENMAFIIGRDIREVQLILSEVQTRFNGKPGGMAALDIALHDAFAQYLEIPLCQFLGQKIDKLPTSITIGIKDINETLVEAKEYVDRGFRVLKVKLGEQLDEDIEKLTKLRERFGFNTLIRVDANQGYDLHQTQLFFQRAEKLQIELVEQPVPVDETKSIGTLSTAERKLVAADESIRTPQDALDLVIPEPLCGIFNIKLMKCGGVAQAIQIARIAELANVNLMWGCNDESIVSISAALHAAFSSAQTKYIDLDGSLDLAQDVVAGGFKLEDGYMSILDKPGLGVELI